MAQSAKLWAVNANRNDDGWNLNAYSVENPNPWNAGNQVLSRYSYISSAVYAEVFEIVPFLQAPVSLPMISIVVLKEEN